MDQQTIDALVKISSKDVLENIAIAAAMLGGTYLFGEALSRIGIAALPKLYRFNEYLSRKFPDKE